MTRPDPDSTEFSGLRRAVDGAILEVRADLDGAVKKLEEVEALFLRISNECPRRINLRFLRRWKERIGIGWCPAARRLQANSALLHHGPMLCVVRRDMTERPYSRL